MSLCDRCYAPGYCCTGFQLFTDTEERTFWLEGDGTVEGFLRDQALPFVPRLAGEHVDEESGRRYGSYTFYCPELQENGRCGIYRKRPQLCRDFAPANGSPLCVHSGGAEGTGDGL